MTELPAVPVDEQTIVAVVAAHPDDETPGASGCLQALHTSGARTRLVVATDGEAAYPQASDETHSHWSTRWARPKSSCSGHISPTRG